MFHLSWAIIFIIKLFKSVANAPKLFIFVLQIRLYRKLTFEFRNYDKSLIHLYNYVTLLQGLIGKSFGYACCTLFFLFGNV